MVIDFAPSKHREAASLWNTIAAKIELGIGAITAALDLVTTVAAVFASLALVFLMIAALGWTTKGKARSARMRVTKAPRKLAVPAYLRRALNVAVPAIIAGWATNGSFLALGSSVLKNEFGATTHAQQSITIPIFAVLGTIGSVLFCRCTARVVSVYGTTALGTGTALSLAALALHLFPAYLVTVAVVGTCSEQRSWEF